MKRTHPSSERGLSSASTAQRRTNKKTRFVSPDEDSARFAEDVDAQLEDSRSATRRGRVKTDGYESDSSDDGEGVVLSRWKGEADGGGGGGGDDDDDDMFAMGDKEGAGRAEGVPGKSKDKSKKEAYLRLGDIEGQEFNEASGSGREEEEESALSADEPEDEDEDEDAAARRRKAGMGFALSAFHMREEMEEGKFTADGGFVRTYDPHAVHDRWLDGTDERAMRRAARAKRAQDRAERGKLRAEAREAAQRQTGRKADMEKQMLAVLRKGETVLEALARLGAKAKKAKESTKKLTRSHAHNMDVDGETAHPEPARAPAPAPAPPKPSAQTSQIEHLTSLASRLMALGDADIYSKTYEHLLRAVRAAGDVEPDWTPPPSVAYEYRWDVPEARGAEAQVFGPFGEDEMKAWYGARYFGLAGEKVKVRASGGDWGSWDDVVD